MKRTFAAMTILASATAFAAPSFAMEQELTMLELAVGNALEQVGVRDVDVMSLTVSQLAIIKNVLASDDSNNDKARRIEAIISR